MATIIAKMAGIIGENTLFSNLQRLEPTPEPTPWQKAGVYEQKAPGFGQKAPGFGQKAPGFGQKAPGYGQRHRVYNAPQVDATM